MAITAKQAIEAVKGSKGFIAVIAARLGCSRSHVYNLRNKYTSVAEAIEDEREKQKDFVEGQLHKKIKAGNMTAIIFYLKTQAKDRGYVERQEQRTINIDLSTLSNAQLQALAEGQDIEVVLAMRET